jgi:2-oxoacid:acceptor oxidoreductase delta subunit (pyruvate/2-ketoisovalerate family)
VALADLETGGYDAIFGVLDIPEHLSLIIPILEGQSTRQEDGFLVPLLGDDAEQSAAIKVPLRVSEAIGYGKWAALLLDADWRGRDPMETLAQIQVGGNTRIVSALKYLALLTGHGVERTEEVVTYEKLNLEMLEPPAPFDAATAAKAQESSAGEFASPDDFQRVLTETSRCFSCGRCNGCDNCWVYCPDAVVSRDQGQYNIDYDYCKGCSVCAAVCPRRVISVIEEEKWQPDSA